MCLVCISSIAYTAEGAKMGETPVGDYYDEEGKYLGSDNINDSLVYIVKHPKSFRPEYFQRNGIYYGQQANISWLVECRGHVRYVFDTGLERNTKDILRCHPAMRFKTLYLLADLNAIYGDESTFFIISASFRSNEEQDSLYAIGRTVPGKKVTYAKGGHSFHNYGLAIDLAADRKGKTCYDFDWSEIASIAKKKYGFSWGGDIKALNDVAHFALKFGKIGKALPMYSKSSLGEIQFQWEKVDYR